MSISFNFKNKKDSKIENTNGKNTYYINIHKYIYF